MGQNYIPTGLMDHRACHHCTVIGPNVPVPRAGAVGVVRIGIGKYFVERQMRRQFVAGRCISVQRPAWLNFMCRHSRAIYKTLCWFSIIFCVQSAY